MALSRNIATLWMLIAVTSVIASTESNDEVVNDLLSQQSRSKSGIIRLNDQSLSRYLTSVKTPRLYSLFVFFDAAQLHDNNANQSSLSKLFFCDLEFKESQLSFSQIGVNALPHIRYVGPNQSFKDSEQMDQGDFSRLAESMAEFVEGQFFELNIVSYSRTKSEED